VTPLLHHEGMIDRDATRPLRAVEPPSAGDDGETDHGPQQLSLLPERPSPTAVSARFRLGRATCERGLRHVAEIKEVLARRQAEREAATSHRLPPRRRPAA